MAWILPEAGTPYAERVMAHLGDEDAIVPSLWPLEVGNALLMAERRKRIEEGEIEVRLERLSKLPVRIEAGFSLEEFPLLGMLSREYGLTAYDATYLELAMRTGSSLASLDKDLLRAARKANVTILEE